METQENDLKNQIAALEKEYKNAVESIRKLDIEREKLWNTRLNSWVELCKKHSKLEELTTKKTYKNA